MVLGESRTTNDAGIASGCPSGGGLIMEGYQQGLRGAVRASEEMERACV